MHHTGLLYRRLWLRTLLLLLGMGSSWHAIASNEGVLRVYLDADRHNYQQSAKSIELGVRAAFAAVGNEVAGYQLEVVPVDHRGNVKRFKLNVRKYLSDDRALAIFGGMHSPPYLRYKDFINANQVLMLLPWSAAGPLTRVDEGENWIFRLSVDDSKAADRLVQFAIKAQSCDMPALVLWDSGWGRTNEKTLTGALTRNGISSAPVHYFQGSLEQSDAYLLATQVAESDVDCVMLVSNSIEGVQIVSELSRLESPPKIISHWGITGADFEERVSADLRDRVDLHFLQTCYPFNAAHSDGELKRAWGQALELDPKLDQDITELSAPAGFFHGYDLAKLMIEALSQHPGVSDIEELRARVHGSLESLQTPVHGLMRTHHSPFAPYTSDTPDAHEALGLDDLCMARWSDADKIEVIPRSLAATVSN